MTEVAISAIRLAPIADLIGTFSRIVKAGVMMIAPPKPTIEPTAPAVKPMIKYARISNG